MLTILDPVLKRKHDATPQSSFRADDAENKNMISPDARSHMQTISNVSYYTGRVNGPWRIAS